MVPQAKETLKVLIYWERKFQFSLKVQPQQVDHTPIKDHTYWNIGTVPIGFGGEKKTENWVGKKGNTDLGRVQ